ncbi:MAG: V-type ATP synthase subunit E [Thermoplasmatales archaeon]
MGLDEIIDRIETETKTKIDEILADANEKARSIIEEANSGSESILERYQNKAREEGEIQSRQIISTATLEGRMAYEKALEAIEKKYFDALVSRIRSFTNEQEYLQFLNRKIFEASSQLGDEFICHLRSEDASRLRRLNPGVRIVEEEVDPIGGVLVTSADGKVIVDFTFSQILRDMKGELSSMVKSHIR